MVHFTSEMGRDEKRTTPSGSASRTGDTLSLTSLRCVRFGLSG